MKTTGLPAPQSVNASFTPVAVSMKSPAAGMARPGAGWAPMASSAADSKPALSVVERVDFKRVRRSILVIPDLVRDVSGYRRSMTRRASRDDYVRGKKNGRLKKKLLRSVAPAGRRDRGAKADVDTGHVHRHRDTS